MEPKIKILIVEHNEHDIDLIRHRLKTGAVDYVSAIAETEQQYIEALHTFIPDIILCDYSFPSFDGESAYNLKQQITPATPFIFVSGTVGEEKAVELIKKGVNDYVVKDSLLTLPQKIKRALEEVRIKKEKEITDQQLVKAKNLYAFISQVNQNIVRVENEATLFHNACRLAVEFGKFKMAWIGLFDHTRTQIMLADQSGLPDEDIPLFQPAHLKKDSPQDSVLTSGMYYICNDISNNVHLKSWEPFTSKHEIRSCLVLPIKKSGIIIGTFNLYSKELDFSGEEEIKLLVEVTNDISFALDVFEKTKRYEVATQLILQHEKKFRHTLDNLLEGIQIHDFDFRYLYVNDVLVKSSTYSREELIGYTLMEKYPGIEHSELFKTIDHCMKERVPVRMETTFTFPNGTQVDFELSIEPIPEGISILSIDRTEHNKAKEKLLKANRLYAFISAINQSIVHVSDEQELLDTACRIAVDIGKFKMSWIDIIDEATGKLNMVSSSGSGEAIRAARKVSDMDYTGPLLKDTPTGLVLSTGQLAVCNDLLNNPSMNPWRKQIIESGIKSGMALPIKKFGKLTGVFGFYSGVENHFDEDETALLEEASADISFALENFEKERKHRATEELVVKNEKRFRAIVEQGTDVVVLFSPEGVVQYVSPSIKRVLGYTEEEAMKLDMFALVHPNDLPGLATTWEKVLAAPGIPIQGHTGQLLHKDGTYRWLEATVTNMLHDPAINAIVDNFRDVTDKVKIAEQQEFEKNNLDALINNTTDLMWSLDRNYNLITSNKPFEEMAKINFGHIIARGESVIGVSHTPEMLAHFKQIYDRAFAGETFTETAHFEIPTEFWSEISYYPIRQGDEIIGTACHSRDITHTKVAERKLTRSESRLKEAQAISHIGNWEVDFAENIHTWSDELYAILGITKGEVQPSTELFLSFLHPEDADEIKVIVDEAFKSLKATSYNFRFIRKDGAVRYGYTERRFEFDKHGKPTRLLGVVQDITDRKLIEQEREKMISSIVQHSNNLEQFTSIVSHNLRAPVANILGLSNVLKNDISPEYRVMAEQHLFTATEQLDEMLKDLNNILQAKSEISEYKETVDFRELLDVIKSSIHTLIETEDVQFITDFEAISQITTIKSYLHSIFYNMISNSIKYKQEGKSLIIRITSAVDKGKMRLSFKDNGIGIDLKRHGDKIFGLYKRFHLQREGKGLGLFMVKTQIETLGGSIRVESAPGEGAEFIVELPL